MTPKEKAIELVDKYIQYVTEINEYEYAKQCALIAVNEMLKHLQNYIDNYYLLKGAIKYWHEVKKEIENL